MGQHPAAWRASHKRRSSPARGILLGVAIGVAMWAVIGAVVCLALRTWAA